MNRSYSRFVIFRRIKVTLKMIRRLMYCLILILTALPVYAYDSQMYYKTVLPLRVVFDLCLFIIIFIITYTLFKLSGFEIKRERTLKTLIIGKKLAYFIPLLNAVFVVNTLYLEKPSLGTLESDLILQGIKALPFYAEYVLACLINGFMLLEAITMIRGKENRVNFYDIVIYSIVFMAIQTEVSIIGFHLFKVYGLRLAIICLFVSLSLVYTYCLHRSKISKVRIEVDKEFPLVLLLSLATLAFYYFQSLDDYYSDQGITLSNVNSILYRESLEPYYKANIYYPAVGGFHVACFIYTTGLNNTILASTLAFTIAYMFLPIIIYKFIRSVVLDNGSIALLATIMCIHMDGIGIIAFPIYKPEIDRRLARRPFSAKYILNFKLSPETCSLYTSTISHLWFNPYKVFAAVVSITSLILLLSSKNRNRGVLLSGILLAFSLIHPKALLIVILTSLILWALRRLSLLDTLMSVLMCLVYLGPLSWAITYKAIHSFMKAYLRRVYKVPPETEMYVSSIAYNVLKYNPLLLPIMAALILVIIYYWSKHSRTKSDYVIANFVSSNKPSVAKPVLFIILSVTIFVAITFYAYGTLPQSFKDFIRNNCLLDVVRYLIFRYHIMIALLIVALVSLKLNSRMILALATLLLSACLFKGRIISFPVSLAVLGIPALYQIIKRKEFRIVIFSLLFIYLTLGTLTSGIYGYLMHSSEVDPIFTDMPHVVNILLSFDENTKVYSGSYSSYRIWRTACFADLVYSNNSSECQLCLIDKQSAILVTIRKENVLYSGIRLVLMKLSKD